jgi:hypothetical protein
MFSNTRTSKLPTPVLLVGLLSLFLSACGTSPVRVEQHATDLEVVKLAVHSMTQPREISGDIKRAEDAENNEQLMKLTLDLEDVKFLYEKDLQRVDVFVTKALSIIAQGRLKPCPWYSFKCRREQTAVLAPFASPPAAPPGQ